MRPVRFIVFSFPWLFPASWITIRPVPGGHETLKEMEIMMMRLRLLFILAALAGALGALEGCSLGPEPGAASPPAAKGWGMPLIATPRPTPLSTPPQPTPARTMARRNGVSTVTAQLVRGNTAFAIALYEQLKKEKQGNLAFSPAGIALALAPAFAGARGAAAGQMARVLGWQGIENPGPLDDELRRINNTERKNGNTLEIAYALWGMPDAGVRADYRRVNLGDPPGAARTINDWATSQTHGIISELVRPTDLGGAGGLLPVSAIHFRPPWASPFDERATQPGPFHPDSRTTLSARLMQVSHISLPLYEDEEVQVLELPCRGPQVVRNRRATLLMLIQPTNSGLVMDVILPRAAQGLDALTLSPEKLEQWLGGLKTKMLRLKLPKFELQSSLALHETLAAMGMPNPFSALKTDLSGMSGPEKLQLRAVLHQASVTIDERGTDSGITTASISGGEGILPAQFIADHPFLFLIRDNRSGAILMLGRLTEPRPVKEAQRQVIDLR